MQRTAYIWILFLCITQSAAAQRFTGPASYTIASYHEAERGNETLSIGHVAAVAESKVVSITQLLTDISSKQRTSRVIGFTKEQRPIHVYYFPGRSNGRALVIGGVHGTELAAIEVAQRLIQELAEGDTPFYNVLIIPALFPDNAALAMQHPTDIGSMKNIGRYTHAEAADPNRQMPGLGKPYDPETAEDYLGRPVEYENGLLLQLIQTYRPQRVVNIHAIRDTAHGGVYADPRTDAAGYALEFGSDSSLAVGMARYIEQGGGIAPGNNLTEAPTALYYKDPPVAAPGQWQKRSCHGALVPGNRGHGVSLGSWVSTAVYDSANGTGSRPAIRLFTMEFPGYKRPQDYDTAQQVYVEKQVYLYATSIQKLFLENLFVEDAITNDPY